MINLAYNYAKIRINSGMCVSCMTYSYEIINDAYIPVPDAQDDYIGTYYNRDTDLWYEDAEMTIEATSVNEMYHGG